MALRMRPSRVLRRLRAGEVVTCTKMNLADPRAFQIAASAGFDCLWTGMEHIPNDWSAIEMQALATKCYDVDLLCRVARGSYSDYIRPLELDATGIMVPHIMSLEDARNVVRMTRFHPVGRRPMDGGNMDGAFCGVPLTEYLEQANRERFIIFQIEDPEPLEELEAIAELPGYDVLLFGAGDFSHAIGAPGQMDHPLIVETRKRIAEVANKYGKFAGALGSPEKRHEFIDMGFRFLSVGADVVGLSKYFRELAASCGLETDRNPAGQYGEEDVRPGQVLTGS